MFGLSGRGKLSAAENPVTLAGIHIEELFSSPAGPKALGWLSEPLFRLSLWSGLVPSKKTSDMVVDVGSGFFARVYCCRKCVDIFNLYSNNTRSAFVRRIHEVRICNSQKSGELPGFEPASILARSEDVSGYFGSFPNRIWKVEPAGM